MTNVKTILVDRRNFDTIKEDLKLIVASSNLIGIDTETHNRNAHDGILEFRKSKETRAFDMRRMVVTGLSIYPVQNNLDGDPVAYYFNLNQADKENRLKWAEVREILDAKRDEVSWVSHNAAYEINVLASCYDYALPNYICTMQMAVSAWGPDEYDHTDYIKANFGEMASLFEEAQKVFATYNPSEGRDSMTPAQSELLAKVLGKSSVASFSYNGLVKELAYSYGLKKIVLRLFNYQMTTYEDTVGDGDMADLTGDQVKDYGAEDAYWAVRVFFGIYEYMQKNCPNAIPTFFAQENPMVQVYSDVRLSGLKVNKPAIEARRELERANFARILRELKATCKSLLPFADNPNDKLAKYDKWYRDGFQKHRDRFVLWANSPDEKDDFKQACQVSSAVSNAWSGGKCMGLSIGHYMQARLMMYDLARVEPIIYKGKVQSDSETRGTIRDKIKTLSDGASPVLVDHYTKADKMIKLLGEIASIEQRMKLYLTPYLLLTDPETGRMYPELSSMLATRRMSCSNPNAQQLAKRGESTYVRGFYLPDADDEVLVSLDWSQIELVLIGEFSGDDGFKEAYGQLPYRDLHLGAAAEVLGVVIEGVTPDLLKNLHKLPIEDIPPKLLIKPNGEPLTPDKAKKFWRTEVGKGSNFNYWYSGALNTVGEKLGWTSDQMWKATEAYRSRFPKAEEWRVGIIENARKTGYVELPDGHRRTRWEITEEWTDLTHKMFNVYQDNGMYGVYKFGQQIIKAVRTRAGNQLVNAMIQGSSATLAKRSILSINKELKENGIRARFKVAIHDELVFSVHRDDVVAFISMAKRIMRHHPEIIKTLKIDCTASVGLTFEPFVKDKVPMGQIELDELPDILGLVEGDKATDEEITKVVDYLFEQRKIVNGH